jgi:hypothetical protein
MTDKIIFNSIPDYLERAKGIAYFIPGPLIIQQSLLNPDEVLEARLLLNQIGLSNGNLAGNKEIIRKYEKYLPFIRTLLHERIHLWQYSSTTFGNFQSLLDLLQTDQILIQTKKIHEKTGNNIKIPLIEWKNHIHNDEITKILNSIDISIEKLQYLQNVLHGKTVIAATEASDIFSETIRILSRKRTDRHLLPPIPGNFHIRSLQDESIPKIGQEYISASAIIEGNAVLYQVAFEMWLGSKLGLDDKKFDHSHLVSPRHFSIFSSLPTITGFSLSSSEWLIIFSIISDISLLTPIDQGYFDIRNGLLWEDIEPGWRFYRMFDYVKQLKIRNKMPKSFLNNRDEEDNDNLYLDISERICDDLNWPTPLEICKRSKEIKNASLHGTLLNKFSDLRIKYPSIFAFPSKTRNMKLLADSSPDIIFFDKISADALLSHQLRTQDLNGLFFIYFYRHLISRGLLQTRNISQVLRNDEKFNTEIHPFLFMQELNFSLDRVETIK